MEFFDIEDEAAAAIQRDSRNQQQNPDITGISLNEKTSNRRYAMQLAQYQSISTSLDFQ